MPRYNLDTTFQEDEKLKGWDVRLQCTVCGFRVRRHRKDYGGLLNENKQTIFKTECSNCTANENAYNVKGGIQTIHFVDVCGSENNVY